MKPATVEADFFEYQSKRSCGRPRTATSPVTTGPIARRGSRSSVPAVSNGNPKKFVDPAAPTALR
jgi:hypothetical protein